MLHDLDNFTSPQAMTYFQWVSQDWYEEQGNVTCRHIADLIFKNFCFKGLSEFVIRGFIAALQEV